jgi:outer membrane protein
MKNTGIIISILALALSIVLLIMQLGSGQPNSQSSDENDSTKVASFPDDIAFVNVDTLLRNYKFYDELESHLLEKQKKYEDELNRKMAAFEKEAAEFQKKVQMNSFLSMESAQRQEQELMQKQQSLIQLREDLTNKFMLETQELDKQLLDTVTMFLEEFNADKKYRYILNYNSFLYGEPALDITDTLIILLNQRYEELNPPKKEE